MFATKWGSRGTSDGQFSGPYAVAVDGQGNMYVADINNQRIQKFSGAGQFITKWGSFGSENGQFSVPVGVAVDGQGNVYVADPNNQRVQKFSGDGRYITKWGSFGSENGQFSVPVGLAVDGQGNVYVTEYGNSRVQKFSGDGQFITKWGSRGTGDGQFRYPFGIAVDGRGNVYVADTLNYRIQKFSGDGQFITKWGSEGRGDGQFDGAFGVAVDGQGSMYVTDINNHRIQKFTVDGQFITKWGSSGTGDGQFDGPRAVAVDGQGNVYIADINNQRIQKFSLAGGPAVTPAIATPTAIPTRTSTPTPAAAATATPTPTRTSTPTATLTPMPTTVTRPYYVRFRIVGQGGNEPGLFNGITSMAVDARRKLIFTGNQFPPRIQVFSEQGVYQRALETPGATPIGIAVDGQGYTYSLVRTDTGGFEVRVWDSVWKYVKTFGNLVRPVSIAGGADYVAVLDPGVSDGMVKVYDTAGSQRPIGTLMFSFGFAGSSESELTFIIKSMTLGPDGRIYVLDGTSIKVFEKWGGFVRRITVYVRNTSFAPNLTALAVLAQDEILVADAASDQVIAINMEGQIQEVVDALASPENRLIDPNALGLTSSRELVVADLGRNRLMVYRSLK